MKSLVYFTSVRTRINRNLLDKFLTLFENLPNVDNISENDLVAIKLHWGEEGNVAYIPPPFLRVLVERLKSKGAKPFLTDTNTLYVGTRKNAVDNITTAIKNGFSYATVGAPIIVADGLRGMDYVRVPVHFKHFKELKIASSIYHSDFLIVLSHFKGHEATGFGGTLKNLSMGCAPPSGKQMMHSDVLPQIEEKACTGCGTCVKWCPASAITMEQTSKTSPTKKAKINSKLCIGCGECTVVCRFSAITINWRTDKRYLQEKMAEYAYGAIENKIGKSIFFNFIMNVSPDCDCASWNDAPIVPNIGILASVDPVAIDQAAVDLVNSTPGIPGTRLVDVKSQDKFRSIHNVDWRYQLTFAEEIGLGKRSYELREIK